MNVNSPRAYAAYARDVPVGPSRSGSAPDSRRLRARVAVRFRLLVCLGELPHHLVAPVVQPAQPPLLPFGERVRGEDREADGVVEVAHHRARQLVGVHLPPAHGFGGRRSGQAARVDAGVCHLEVVVMPFLADPNTSWICGSVCSTKFLGLPPPMIRMPLLPPWVLASNTIADVSFTSALESKRSCDPVSACSATFIPMDESPGDDV